ncbi:MAG: rhomboid family intramembrane serine protease [Myxococcales bacterium]|nr:rhomboid family intramembrane serine protease [Myxococcales bacterium]
MKSFWYRALIVFYRLLGSTPTQAEWRARRALGAPDRVKGDVADHVRRAQDTRHTCHACGQLLTAEDKRCHACGARQWIPPGLRRVVRLLGLGTVGPQAGSTLAIASMVVGFLVQLRFFGGGAFMSGVGGEDGYAIFNLGVSFPELVKGHQPWRAFTYTLFHGGIIHLAFNAFALLQIGPAVERWFGFGRFWFGWTVTGIAGAALPILIGIAKPVPLLGASGAVTGLVGMAMVFGHMLATPQGIALRNAMIKWMVYITVFGMLMGGVAHDAHFAGFAAGAVLAWLLPPVQWRPKHRKLTPVITALGLILALVPTGQFVAFILTPEAERVEQLFPEAARQALARLRTDPPPADDAAFSAWLGTFLEGAGTMSPALRYHYLKTAADRLPARYRVALLDMTSGRRRIKDLPR